MIVGSHFLDFILFWGFISFCFYLLIPIYSYLMPTIITKQCNSMRPSLNYGTYVDIVDHIFHFYYCCKETSYDVSNGSHYTCSIFHHENIFCLVYKCSCQQLKNLQWILKHHALSLMKAKEHDVNALHLSRKLSFEDFASFHLTIILSLLVRPPLLDAQMPPSHS